MTAALEITTAALDGGQVGVEYDEALTATGGASGGYTWRIESGALPAGLILAGAQVRGVPTADGDFSFTVEVRDLAGTTAKKTLTIAIEPAEAEALAVITTSLPSAVSGMAYEAVMTAGGGSLEDYRWSVSSGALPVGLTLAAGGTPSTSIEGTTAEFGSFDFTVRVTDSTGAFAEREFTLVVRTNQLPLQISTAALPSGPIGSAYQATLEAVGGTGSGRVWSIDQGALPAGLSLSAAGEITGIPTAVGISTFTVRVTDPSQFINRELSITVSPVGLSVAVVTLALPTGESGVNYDTTIVAVGGTEMNYTWSIVQGELPPGISVESMGTPATRISGVPTVAGTYTFTVRVADSVGQSGERELSLNILPGFIPVHIVTSTVPAGAVAQPYFGTITAADGTGMGYGWIAAGALPPGLAIDSSGTPSTQITGTPLVSGTYTATITVFDSNNDVASQVFTFEIGPPLIALAFSTVALPNAGISVAYSETITARDGSAFGYLWSIEEGSLPPGLTLQAAGTPSTTLSGVPTASGLFEFTVRVEDSDGGVALQAFSLTVGNALVIVTASLPPAFVNQPYLADLVASGGSGSGYVWSVTQGQLPAGLTLAGTGTPNTSISGTPSGSTSETFEIEVRDSNNTVSRSTFTLRVTGAQRHVAWVGDTAVDNDTSVFVVDISGPTPGAPVQVSPLAPGTGDAPTSASFTQFSPDNTKIAFRGDFQNDGVQELFMVDLSGPSPATAVRVSGPMVAGGALGSFGWSPDSRWLTYQADQDVDAILDQYVVDVGTFPAGAPMKISGAMVNGGDVGIDDFGFSPDSTRAYYLADQEVDNVFYLYVVDLSSGSPSAPMRVNLPLDPAAADVSEDGIAFTADSEHIIYVADQTVTDVDEIFIVDVGGPAPGTPVRLNGPLVAGGDVLATRVQLSPDRNWLVYIADQDTDTVNELYAVDLRGAAPAAPVKLNPPLVNAGDVATISWSPDSSRLMYLADADTDVSLEVYMVGVGGFTPTTAIKVNAPIPASSVVVNNVTNGFIWSPDASWVAYRADQNVEGAFELFVVPMIAGLPGPAVLVNSPLSVEGDIVNMFFSPGSDQIAFRGDMFVNDHTELYVSSLASGVPSPPILLASAPFQAGNVDTAFFWLGNSRIAFSGDLGADGVVQAYLVDVTATPPVPVALHPTPPTGGDVNTLFAQ